MLKNSVEFYFLPPLARTHLGSPSVFCGVDCALLTVQASTPLLIYFTDILNTATFSGNVLGLSRKSAPGSSREMIAIGVYAGGLVTNSEIGRPYVSLKYPSRYVAVVQGNIPALIQAGASKCSVDAQLTEVHGWRWVKINCYIGPFLNAPDDDDPDDEVNCTLGRRSL
jgi:hypothetical protein